MDGHIDELFRSSRISASALKANRNWMNIISNNLANAQALDTGKTDSHGNYVPYARQVPVFARVLSEKFRENKVNEDVAGGVAVEKIVSQEGSVKKIWDPSHPAARKEGSVDAGYVYYPDISTTQEMADMKMAAAAYEANLTVMSISERMMQQALGLGSRRV